MLIKKSRAAKPNAFLYWISCLEAGYNGLFHARSAYAHPNHSEYLA